MKITISSFNFIRNLADKNTIIADRGGSTSGIKTYGKIMGWLLSHFGDAIEIRDSRHVWYVNKEDFRSWAADQGASVGFDLKQLDSALSKWKAGKSDIGRLKLSIDELESKPNKTVDENQKLMVLNTQLDQVVNKKSQELANYIRNLQVESPQEINSAVREWMRKFKPILQIYGELSEERENKIVNDTIDIVTNSKLKTPTIRYVLTRLTTEVPEQLKIN